MKFFIQCCLMLSLLFALSKQSQAQATLTIDTIIDATCNASDNGAILISVAGTPPFTYAWSNGATTQDITGLFSGSFVVTVTDGASGVTVSNVLTVNAPPVINVITDTVINIRCAGDVDGAVNLTVTGGAPGYTYIWDNGATTQDVTGLGAGSINLTVTDANGCTASSKSILLDSVPAITLVLDTINNISCNAANDGYINVTAGGGAGNFTYLWSSGQTTDDISGLMAGAYTVTATDSNGCTMVSGPHTITQPNVLALSLDSITNILCNGDGTGAVHITTAGGTGPFTYNWSNSATTEDITGLNGGTYNVTVTDANGCIDSLGPNTVAEPTLLVLTLDSIQHIDCNGNGDGAVFVSVTGGTTAYTYNWSNAATTQDITGLNGGSYTITVTDANGCSVTDTAYVVNEPTVLASTLDSIVNVSCNGFGDGGVFISTTGGTTAYTFNWSNGATTEDNTGLNGGTYTVTITDANGCTTTSGPHTVVEPAGMTVTLDTIVNILCNGDSTGSIGISVAGGAPAYSYAWSNSATTQDISGLAANTYLVTVTDNNGCTVSSGPHVVTESSVIVVNVDTVIHQLCANDPTGAVNLTVSGGVPGYTYLWDNGATTQDVSGLYSGANNVTVTDANGCTASAKSISLDSIQPIVITVDSIVDVSCNGANDGGVFITVTGGTGGTYIYNWSNGATTQNLTGLDDGSYSVTVTDSNSCVMLSGPHVVNEPNVLVVTVDSLHQIDCNGDGDGAVFISVTGGTTAYTYNWSNGGTTQDITGLNGGSYTVIVTDANGCIDSVGPSVITEPTVLTLTLDSINQIDCNGDGDGGVFVSVTGGTTTYTYNWSNAATTQDITGLNGGSYTITVTDANGCTVSDTAYVVNEPAVLTATLDSIVNVSCNGFGDGGVFISLTGGTTAYAYNWSNGATTEDNTGLNGGTYSITITDANGCTTTSGPHTVTEPAGMTVTLDTIIDVSCNGSADGSVAITVTGGAPTYSYAWSNAGTTEDITGLNGGSYTVTVSDANGCTISSGPHVVDEDSLIVITLDSINGVSCNGASDGNIGISVTGGVPAYTYAWSNAATTQDILGLNGGSYTITVTDASGCTMTDTAYVVNEPAVLAVTFDSLHNVDCNGANNGAVFVTVVGGTTNYTFNWSNGGTTEDITGLAGGSYTVTVTDANGCVDSTGPHVVAEPTAITIAVDSIDHVSCNGSADGAVFITASGGTVAYTYLWSNAGTTQNITGLSGGMYTLTLTDANGCTATSGPHTVNEDSALVIAFDSVQHVSCNGSADGAVFITTTGGVPSYTYAWSNAGTTSDITGLSGGTYTVTATDSVGCTAISGPHTVNEPAVLTATLDSIVNVSCNGGSDGAVFVSIGGGTVPFSYNWSNGGTTQDITGLIAGTYTVTITDSNSCVVTTGPHIVTEPTAISIVLDSINNVTCNGASNGGVYVTTTGGTPAYSYAWSNAGTTEDITGLSGGTYTLTVTDDNGCTATSGPHTVGEPAVLAVVIDSFKNESCAGVVDGLINTSASGGTAPFSFNWSNGATTDDITGLIAGTYTVTITDSNSCMAIDSVTLNNVPTITITLDGIDSVSCNGLSDGAVNITTTLGAPAYSWAWSNGATTEDATGLAVNNYTVTVTDALGCTATAGAYTVLEPAILAVNLDNINNVSCNGAGDGAVNVTTTGGTLAYSFAWSGGQSTEDIAGLNGSVNTITVTDANGCTATSGPHTVNEATGIVITLDNIDSVSCNGASDGAVAITVTGGVPTYSYNWNNGAGATQDLTNVNGNSYTVTVTDAANCTATSGPHVVDEPAALALVITPTVPLEGCLGEAVGVLDAIVTGGVTIASYQWSNGATTASNTGLNTGVYNLTATDVNGCTITGVDSIQNPVRPTVDPFVGQSPIKDTTINWGDVITVDAGNDQTANGVTYNWTEVTSLGGINFDNSTAVSTDVNPQPAASGTYTLLVTATSGDGCIDTGSVRITVTINDLVGIPTAFTPNGDGVNDLFRPASLDKQFILEFKIYNRWGQVIFNDTDTDTQWDGTFNGVEQPTEVYIYVLRYKIPGQEERVLRGEFTLIR